ncbi:MAG: enoyl-CoA hydratase/isomerase family protein [Litoreibacter sp.]
MTELPVRVERSGSHMSIVLTSPATSNALSPVMVETMIAAIGDNDVRSCVIQGDGRNFCGGFDLSDIAGLSDGDLLHRFLRIETLLQMIYHAPFPVAAFIQGHAIGAGADLMASCWKRVAAPNARFKFPGWNFELALGTRRLSRLIGSEHARDMLIDARSVDAEEALAIGLVSKLAAKDEWADQIADFKDRSMSLSRFANRTMLDLTVVDTRTQDMAAIVETAGRPGLKERIQNYSAAVAAAREQRKQ